jgi:hypothetical protein
MEGQKAGGITDSSAIQKIKQKKISRHILRLERMECMEYIKTVLIPPPAPLDYHYDQRRNKYEY